MRTYGYGFYRFSRFYLLCSHFPLPTLKQSRNKNGRVKQGNAMLMTKTPFSLLCARHWPQFCLKVEIQGNEQDLCINGFDSLLSFSKGSGEYYRNFFLLNRSIWPHSSCFALRALWGYKLQMCVIVG